MIRIQQDKTLSELKQNKQQELITYKWNDYKIVMY